MWFKWFWTWHELRSSAIFSRAATSQFTRTWSEKWAKMPSWCQRSGENDWTGLRAQKGNSNSKKPIPTTKAHRRLYLWIHNAVSPWSKWATAAQDHTGCCSCQLRTGNWSKPKWSNKSWFLLPNSDSRVSLYHKQHESLESHFFCLVPADQTVGAV